MPAPAAPSSVSPPETEDVDDDAPVPGPLPDPFVRVELKPCEDGAALMIPADLLAEAGLTAAVGGTVELRVKRGQILVGPKPNLREGWEEAAAAIAAAGEGLVWPETPEEVGRTGWDW